ncbi:MAG: hypothetical protein ACXVJL_04320 [Candidatus Angelobacter sp.]
MSLMKGISHLSNRWLISISLVVVTTIFSSSAAVGQKKNSANPKRGVPAEQKQKEEASQKYREIFFPKGMPTEEDPVSGQQKPTLYAFYDEARLGDSLTAVLFSKKIPNQEGDASYTVSLGLLSGTQPTLSVMQVLDLTESMPVQTEEPGNFYRMDGRVDTFNLTAGALAAHVNLWAVLAGSGSISGASDLFFKVEPQKLEKLLDLKGTSQFSRLGADQSTISNSTIFAGDVDGDGMAEIVVEKSSGEDLHGKRTMHTDKPVLYKIVDGQYHEKGTIDKDEVAKRMHDLKRLARSPFIRVVTPAETAAETKN